MRRYPWPVAGLMGLGLAGALVLAACGSATGGGTAAGSGTKSGGSTAGLPSSTSLKGWTVVVGSGGTGPAIDSTVGTPKPPSLELPGDKSYVWTDAKKAVNSFSFDANSQGLFDLFFGANAAGQGLMFRIDTRGGTNYSGFGETEDWNDWECPQSGTTDLPANTWIHVAITIKGADVTAVATPTGAPAETFTFNGTTAGCNTMGDGTVLDTSLAAYKPVGTAFGFQGDGLGATSETWIANFK